MLPQKLIIQAFGAYNKRTEIDFSILKSNNIYLIGGATGSGKTTIFSAITYALFNSPSGSDRGNIDLRSHYALDTDKSFVEFEFLFNGENYKVIRSLAYKRKKVKGEGFTTVEANAELYLPDGRIIIGSDKVTNEITTLLGINKEQFCQISLLAQGEFLKLLNTDTETRGKIFRKIFKTSACVDFQQILSKKVSDLKAELDLDNKLIIQNISLLKSDNTEINGHLEKIIKEKTLTEIETLFSAIENQNKDDETTIQTINKLIAEINTKLQNSIIELERINSKIAFEEKLKEIEIEIKASENDFNNIKETYSNLDNLKNELEKYKKELDKLNEDFEKIEAITKIDCEINNFKNQKIIIENKINDCNQQIENYKICHLKFLYQNYFKACENLKNAQDDFEKSKIEYQQIQNEYNNAYTTYLSIQAGILAAELKDGSPCPVCGSKEHPNIARLSDNAITKDELDNLKQKTEEFSNTLKFKSESCTILNEQKTQSLDTFERYKNIYNKNIDNSLLLADLEVKNADYIKLIDESTNDKTLLQEKLNAINIEYSNLETRKKTIFETLTEKNIETISLRRNELVQNVSKSNDNIKQIEDNYNSINKKLNDLISKKKVYISELSNLSEINTGEIDNKKLEIANLKNQLDESTKKINIVSNRLETNNIVLINASNNYKKIKDKEKVFSDYLNLSDCASGKISGRAKIAFEQYIQSYYLDMVLFEANKRFKIMTQNRYQLRRKKESDDKKQKTGLDIEVFDFYTFKHRGTKTLSGGESFMAALSLALGLSDTVSNMSGSINMDSLFIDEGFGTLDNETLDIAMNVISDLSQNNRLIGIISHVEELKNKIENRIITYKSPSGSIIETNFMQNNN